MELQAPDPVKNFLSVFVQAFLMAFEEKLIGIYLHGSLAMGSFNPVSSDVDLLVVVRDELSLTEKSRIGQVLLRLSEDAPANGLEMSIITLQSLTSFQYPTPYEVHFSNSNKDRFAQGTIDFTRDLTDSDLAAHFVITKARGICLYGERIGTLFPDVPRKDYLASLAEDSDWSYRRIMQGADSGECSVPVYGVLNFCRVLAFIEQGFIASKSEGGQWGIEHLPSAYQSVIQAALKDYATSGTASQVACSLLKAFARYANAIIQQANQVDRY